MDLILIFLGLTISDYTGQYLEEFHEMVDYINSRAPRKHGMCGVAFQSDRSRHPI